jgi:hypothetical protein
VGLSLLRKLRDPDGELPPGSGDLAAAIRRSDPRPADLLDPGATRPEASEWLAEALAGGAPAALLLEVAEAVQLPRWPLSMSAELETFAKVQQSGTFTLGRGDIAVLICSDTPEGLLAGLWNAVALVGGDLARVRYVPDASSVPDPSRALGDVRGKVVLARVTGMDAGNAGFRDAMGGLGLLARHLFASKSLTQGEEFRFHLSGGFKAAIPYLIGMAEAIRSVDATCLSDLGAANLMPKYGPYPVTAYVAHETVETDLPPIRLPLRLLDAEAVRYELKEFGKSLRHGLPDGALLNGYAYECSGKKGTEVCTLTAFGQGLRELFGIGTEGYAG